jgi:transposase
MSELSLAGPAGRVRKKRVNKAVGARFKPDISEQFDLVWGCASVQLPKEHLVRGLKRELALLDVSAIVDRYSSQGRHGFHPLHVLGALVYGSLIGIHHSTALARAMRTDVALRFIAGGHAISEGRLRAFRRENLALFTAAFEHTLRRANQLGLLDARALAVDSVRLRAAASTKAVKTKARSAKRLEELGKVDVSSLSAECLEEHQAKVEKHRGVVELCNRHERTNVVTTSPSAGLMKFPDGASGPGHRGTVVATGVKERIVVDVLVDADATDFGKFGPAILRARERLLAAGVPLDEPMQAAGDAGYFSTTDLAFAAENRKWIDSLIQEGARGRRKGEDGEPIFGLDDFTRDADGSMRCPAQKKMSGPFNDGGRERWHGTGCGSCGLKPQCTKGTYRSLTLDPRYVRLRDAMRARFAEPGAEDRYNQRIATVEPVFSSIESNFGFRRVSSRHAVAVQAEIMLKVLAYNLSRLLVAKRLRHVLMVISLDAASFPEADA